MWGQEGRARGSGGRWGVFCLSVGECDTDSLGHTSCRPEAIPDVIADLDFNFDPEIEPEAPEGGQAEKEQDYDNS
jgi:hypothetical protein